VLSQLVAGVAALDRERPIIVPVRIPTKPNGSSAGSGGGRALDSRLRQLVVRVAELEPRVTVIEQCVAAVETWLVAVETG